MEQKSTGGKATFEEIVSRVLGRLKNRPDSEHEQAWIRIAISFCVVLYLIAIGPENFESRVRWEHSVTLTTSHFLLSLGLWTAILINPEASVIRRALGIIADIGGLSYALFLTSELGAPWYGLYLWVILGNGFRYGAKYLYFTAAIAALGFSAVISYNVFWLAHIELAIGLLATLIIIPGSASIHISRASKKHEQTGTANHPEKYD